LECLNTHYTWLAGSWSYSQFLYFHTLPWASLRPGILVISFWSRDRIGKFKIRKILKNMVFWPQSPNLMPTKFFSLHSIIWTSEPCLADPAAVRTTSFILILSSGNLVPGEISKTHVSEQCLGSYSHLLSKL